MDGVYDEMKTRRIACDATLMQLCPFKSGFCKKFFCVLASKDMSLVKRLYGLDSVVSVNEDDLLQHIDHTLRRGLRLHDDNSGEYANTNKSYWPRQAMFLEFLEANPELSSTAQDVAVELGRALHDLPLEMRIQRSILFVSAKAAAAFLEFVSELRNKVLHLFSSIAKACDVNLVVGRGTRA